MKSKNEISAPRPADVRPIESGVVHEPGRSPRLSRGVAFVWGGEAAPAPSLPFGRWKPGARAA
jgi:hypothetical protein